MNHLRQRPERLATTVASVVSHSLVAPYRFVIRPVIQAIGPDLSEASVDTRGPVFNGVAVAAFALVMSLALLMIAIGQQGGHQGAEWGPQIYWSGLFVLTLPLMFRLVSQNVNRLERIVLLLILTEGSFAVSLLSSPTRVSHFDEFLHFLTATHIMQSHRLFQENSLLPVSPLYPGLEILTTALANLARLPLFGAAVAVLLVVRPLLMSALFLIYEKIGGSAQLAAVGCLVYMGNSGYILFDAQFAYESLAIVLLTLVLLASAGERGTVTTVSRTNVLVLVITVGLAVTHHVTGAVAVALLSMPILLNILSGNTQQDRRSMMLVAGIALLLMVAWSFAIGNPVVDYLGPVFQAGIDGFFHSASKPKEVRQAFVAADGTSMPLVLQLLGMGSIVIVAVGLATGFFRSLAIGTVQRGQRGWFMLLDTIRCRWVNHRAILLTLMALCWPLSIILRLTPGGWEIGNRMGPYIYFGVGFVVAVAITQFWQRIAGRYAPFVTAVALSIVYVGGVVTGWGIAAAGTTYKIEADASSIEPMGIDAAKWTREWLGPGNRFVADRTNQLLLAIYGGQTIITSLGGDLDPSYLFVWPDISADTVATLQTDETDYMLVDLRISEARPALGAYFAPGEDDIIHANPPSPTALLKYDDQPLVGRLFDDGYIVIYDVRMLRDGR